MVSQNHIIKGNHLVGSVFGTTHKVKQPHEGSFMKPPCEVKSTQEDGFVTKP